MLLERIRLAGIAMICAAISLAAWKVFGRGMAGATPGAEAAAREDLTIPIEIVVAGEEPRLHEVRVPR